MSTIYFFIIYSRRARKGAENETLLQNFVYAFSSVAYISSIIFIMKINIEEESGILITYCSLRPRTEGSMRLCVKIFE